MKSNLPELKDLFGFINVFKPRGITSHDVVSRLRKALKIKQIGHTGTLDPLAEGVLPVAIGKATRLIEYLAEGKGYIASLQFGKVSDTYDTEGNVTDFSDKKVQKEEIINALTKFQGEIEQIPPAYSAVHYKGKRRAQPAGGAVPEQPDHPGIHQSGRGHQRAAGWRRLPSAGRKRRGSSAQGVGTGQLPAG